MVVDPVAISIGPLDIRWYGLVYVLGFLFAYWFVTHYARFFSLPKEKVEDIFFWVMVGSVLGGRLFYILFYRPDYYLAQPLKVFAVWEGGMSIHGGIFMTIVILWWASRQHSLSFTRLADLFSVPGCLAFAFGRLANHINQEVIGTPTTSTLGIVYPAVDEVKRWPVALLAGVKNLVLFQATYAAMLFASLPSGMLAGLFLIGYNLPRFFIDFLREPTRELIWFSMGQWLSLAFTAFGLLVCWYAVRNHRRSYSVNKQQQTRSSRKGKR